MPVYGPEREKREVYARLWSRTERNREVYARLWPERENRRPREATYLPTHHGTRLYTPVYALLPQFVGSPPSCLSPCRTSTGQYMHEPSVVNVTFSRRVEGRRPLLEKPLRRVKTVKTSQKGPLPRAIP